MKNNKAETWENDVIHHLKTQRFVAYVWSLGLLLAVICLSLAVVVLTPLKEIQPLVIEVERSTGQVFIRTNLVEKIKNVGEKNAIIEAFLAKYVMAWKTYEYTDNNERQKLIQAMSTRTVYQQYEKQWLSKDEEINPNLRYGLKDKAEVEIISVAMLNETTHQVRLAVKETIFGGTEALYYFVAIIKHEISPAGMTQKERWKNPIGFLVSSIRFDEEYID